TPKMGRPAKGSLYWATSGWRARLTVTIDGERVRKSYDLETQDKAVARIKLNRLIAAGTSEQPTEEDAKREETFQEAAERLLKSSTIRSKEYRKGRLRNHVYQAFGSKPVSQIRRGDIRDVLRALVDKGASRQS